VIILFRHFITRQISTHVCTQYMHFFNCTRQQRNQRKNLGTRNSFGGDKIFYFRRTTLFCSGYCLLKHKMTIFLKFWRGLWPPRPPWLRILHTIHFELACGINPAAIFCPVQNKVQVVYDRMLNEVKRMNILASPERILLDFASSTINAFVSTFSHATVTGCYFHLTQSVMRKVD